MTSLIGSGPECLVPAGKGKGKAGGERAAAPAAGRTPARRGEAARATRPGDGTPPAKKKYLKPDRLNVENILPVARRIVADGQTFYSYIQGDPKGFSRPVAQLNEEMTIQLRKVPGTPMDHLMRLRGAPETELPPAPDLPVRRGYALPKMFVVLGVDATGRLARVEFYTDARMQERTGYYNFRLFHEVLPGVWIPYLHEGHVVIQGHENTEVSRIMNYTVNQPLASNLFVAAPFFPSVEFVDEFEKIYP